MAEAKARNKCFCPRCWVQSSPWRQERRRSWQHIGQTDTILTSKSGCHEDWLCDLFAQQADGSRENCSAWVGKGPAVEQLQGKRKTCIKFCEESIIIIIIIWIFLLERPGTEVGHFVGLAIPVFDVLRSSPGPSLVKG